MIVLAEFTSEGDLPLGVHSANWREFQSRFGTSTPRRVWLLGRLELLLGLATSTKKLRRVFVWGSYVSSKPSPNDLDILLIMDEDSEVERIDLSAQAIFDSVQAKLLFDADVFWARSSTGQETLRTWLETYQITRGFRKRGIVELEVP